MIDRFRASKRLIEIAILILACLQTVGASAQVQSESADLHFESLTIVVPALPGGGWDLTAQALSKTLRDEGLVDRVRIEHSPGAGGLIGLAEFIEGRRGDDSALLVAGMFTVGAAAPNRARVSLLDTTPIARLTDTSATIVVPVESPIMDIGELVLMFESRPETITWTGGSIGGPDEMLVQSLAVTLGVEAAQVHYKAYPGGSEVGAALIAGDANVGVSDYSELESLISAGHLRALALSGSARLPGVDIPTLKERGIDITLGNWRAVFAPPGISAAQRDRLIELVRELSDSDVWLAAIDRHHWIDSYLAGQDFESFLQSQYTIASALGNASQQAARVEPTVLHRTILLRYPWIAILVVISIVIASVAYWQRYQARRSAAELAETLEGVSSDAEALSAKLDDALQGRARQIEADFDEWGLSAAEKEIALFLLKGLRLQEIADLRHTSERTVRQQAQAIYRKAGLDGRIELSAHFVEDLMKPVADSAGQQD
jgi:putative tricarboxylic transport membrane protein